MAAFLSSSELSPPRNCGVVEHLVADSAAFLKCAPLQNMGKNIYTVEEVLNEIKDKATRQRLAVLPYELKFREPSTESLRIMTTFAQKIGDYRSLSAVDIKVLALTYQLHKEFCGVEDLKLEPSLKVQITTKKPVSGNLPGFYHGSCASASSSSSGQTGTSADVEMNSQDEYAMDIESTATFSSVPDEISHSSSAEAATGTLEPQVDDSTDYTDEGVAELAGDEGEAEYDEDEGIVDDAGDVDDDDDDGGWITPGNIRKVQAQFGEMHITPTPADVPVGCLTTDFAMQNVLIHMGLHVVSLDGMLIKEVKNYVLKCYSCFKVSKEMHKLFCPSCGNKTLVKVAVTVDENGVMQYHISKRRRPFNIRGTKHPIPLPKGGRHAMNEVLCEDQSAPRRNLPRSKESTLASPLDPDYVSRLSPFAMKDVHSRASALGFHTRSNFLGNPNKVQKKSGRRKK